MSCVTKLICKRSSFVLQGCLPPKIDFHVVSAKTWFGGFKRRLGMRGDMSQMLKRNESRKRIKSLEFIIFLVVQ